MKVIHKCLLNNFLLLLDRVIKTKIHKEDGPYCKNFFLVIHISVLHKTVVLFGLETQIPNLLFTS